MLAPKAILLPSGPMFWALSHPRTQFGSFLCLTGEFFPSPGPGTTLTSAPLSPTCPDVPRCSLGLLSTCTEPDTFPRLGCGQGPPECPGGARSLPLNRKPLLSQGLAPSQHSPHLWGPCEGASPKQGRGHTPRSSRSSKKGFSQWGPWTRIIGGTTGDGESPLFSGPTSGLQDQ